MSRYSGAQGKGARKMAKKAKRIQAEARNEKTHDARRRKNRLPK